MSVISPTQINTSTSTVSVKMPKNVSCGGSSPDKITMSPKSKVVPQQPGPDGSRVVRKRVSIPRLGAGFGKILSHLDVLATASPREESGSSEGASDRIPSKGYAGITEPTGEASRLRRRDIKLAQTDDLVPSASCLQGTAKPSKSLKRAKTLKRVKTQKPAVDGENEYDHFSSDSPLTSTEEDTTFDVSVDIPLSTPNSTPPLPRDQYDGKTSPTFVTPLAKRPSQPITGVLPSSRRHTSSYQSMPHLADKLMDVAPHLVDLENTPHRPPACSEPPAAHYNYSAIAGSQGPLYLGPTNAQVFQFLESTQVDGNVNYVEGLVKDLDAGVVQHLVPAERLPSQGFFPVDHSNAYSPTFVPTGQPIEGNHVCLMPIGPHAVLSPSLTHIPPVQQYCQPLSIWSREQKLALLEHKLKRLLIDDGIRANGTSSAVHVFVDMSNIWIGFINAVKAVLGVPQHFYLKTPISFEFLARILERGRNVQKRVLAGSLAFPASRRENWPLHLREAESMKYDMNIFDRVQVEQRTPKRPRRQNRVQFSAPYGPNEVASADESTEDANTTKLGKKHGEQGVGKYMGSPYRSCQSSRYHRLTESSRSTDENLHLNMMHSIIDSKEPGTMVVATGDAAQAQFSDGFKQHATRALRAGWKVEVVSWTRNMSSAWQDPEFTAEFGDQFRIIVLDEFIEELYAGHAV